MDTGTGTLFNISWVSHNSTIVQNFQRLYGKETFCDATIVCDGKHFPVHRLVLSSCSDYFEEIFKGTPCRHPFIVLKDVEIEIFEDLVEFMYKGEVNIVQDRLPMFIGVADSLKIKGISIPDQFKASGPNMNINEIQSSVVMNPSDTTSCGSKESSKSHTSENSFPCYSNTHHPMKAGERKRELACSSSQPIKRSKIAKPAHEEAVDYDGHDTYFEKHQTTERVDDVSETSLRDEAKNMEDAQTSKTKNNTGYQDGLLSLVKMEDFTDEPVDILFSETTKLKDENEFSLPSCSYSSISHGIFGSTRNIENCQEAVANLSTSSLPGSLKQDLERGQRADHQINKEAFEFFDREPIKELVANLGHQIKIHQLVHAASQSEYAADLSESFPSTSNSNIPQRKKVPLQLPREDFLMSINEEQIDYEIQLRKPKLHKKLTTEDYKPNLSDKHMVTRLCVDWLCLQTKGYPSAEMKSRLAEVIGSTYPCLKSRDDGSMDLWYHPPSSRGKAGGLIEVRCHNWRKNLPAKDKKFIRNKNSKNTNDINSVDHVLMQSMRTDKPWLLQYSSAMRDIQERMGREKERLKISTLEFLKQRPQDIEKEQSIRDEFEKMMKNDAKANGLIDNFTAVAPKLIEIAVDKYGSDDNFIRGDGDQDVVIHNAFYLLPRLLPQGNICIESGPTQRKCLKPSFTDSFPFFISVFPEGTKIEAVREDRPDLSTEPVVIVIGDWKRPAQCSYFVFIDGVAVECKKLLTAVDCCVKVFHLFNLCYPKYVKNVYLFLELFFYKFQGLSNLPTCVLNLKDQLL